MNEEEIQSVIQTWCSEYVSVSKHDFINYIQIFENKGAIMGCSNPHPHCQIWATEKVPNEVQLEIDSFKKWKNDKKSCLLCSYLDLELKKNSRIISMNESFVTLVPYWAQWPFETMILPIKHLSSLKDLTSQQEKDLAASIKELTTRYDNIFSCSFPYSMGIHQSPTQIEMKDFHLHLHFYPPLLRSSTVKKFFVGYELLGEPQRDITAEKACEIIRSCSTIHYTQGLTHEPERNVE
jgi:UDPglucose--hexose-1-phosphate uridylyltransferase